MKSFIISTQATSHNEWLAFSCWYSIHRNAPEIKISVMFPRESKTFQYNWLRKCEVPFLAYSAEQDKNFFIKDSIVIPDHIMMIRSDGEILNQWPLATDEEPSSFVDINQVGKFNLKEWIKKEKGHPFHKTNQMGRERNVNEQKVIALWRQMSQTFDFINR